MFIVVSGQRDAECIDHAIQYGAKYVMLKPIDPEVMYGRMKLLACRCSLYGGTNETAPVYENSGPDHHIFQMSEYDKQIEYEIMKSLYKSVPLHVKV